MQPQGAVLPPLGLPTLQEVQAPSGGRWGMFSKEEAGASGAFGNPPGKLLNLFSIGCRLLIISLSLTSNSMPLFFSFFFVGSCMESAEGKRMIQKYEDVLSLLEK